MEDRLKKDFADAVAYWNSALGATEEEKQEIRLVRISYFYLEVDSYPTREPGTAREQDTISFGEASPERTKSEPQNLSMLKRSVNQA